MKHTNEKQFKQLYELLYPKMMALACRFVSDSVAKDMVQEAFISYWEQKDTIAVINAHAYIYRSVQNNCLNYIKHNKIVTDYQEHVRIAEARIQFLNEMTDENDLIRKLERQDIRQIVEQALKKLPPRTQEAFRLCYFEELTYKEAAEVMDISHRTVEVHVQKAVALLRKDITTLSALFLLLIQNLH